MQSYVSRIISKPPKIRRLPSNGNGIDIGLHTGISHELLHALIADLSRRPENPGEDDRLVFLLPDGHREGCDLAVGYVVAPALDHFQGSMLLENDCRVFGVLYVGLAVCGWYGCNESIHIGHRFPSSPGLV